jgi:hypothetical protein
MVDGFQFYALRAGAEWASDEVSTRGYERYLWANGSFVYIGTTKHYGLTPVAVEVLDREPGTPEDVWQHVAEVSLAQGGDLEIFGEPNDPVAIIELDPGPARVRVSWRGLVPGLSEGLDQHGYSDEELQIQVWPAEPSHDAVLRWWPPRVLPEPTTTSPQGLRQIEGYEVMAPTRAGMEVRASLSRPYPSMPGGGERSVVYLVLFDPTDGSWWVDGDDIRRTLREVSQQDAARLIGAEH